VSTKQKIKIAKARSFVKLMDAGQWISDGAFALTMEVASEYGDDALWQQS